MTVAAAGRVNQAGQQQAFAMDTRQVAIDQAFRFRVAASAVPDLIDRRHRRIQIVAPTYFVWCTVAVGAACALLMDTAADLAPLAAMAARTGIVAKGLDATSRMPAVDDIGMAVATADVSVYGLGHPGRFVASGTVKLLGPTYRGQKKQPSKDDRRYLAIEAAGCVHGHRLEKEVMNTN